ncbi:methyltransferase family protein [Kamptonema formosum]|uniref:methyltransferase family protein n=1 Tax=Kamptonema formosum TaxID=331992 RepID=UPI000348BB8C|nr:isoprenylcysteine carboxylmethyltransferase family protein [Oscillatoria sp. PCC 10802]
MKIFTDWGFTREGWRNNRRGEYWVVLQGALLLGFVLLPVCRPAQLRLDIDSQLWYVIWGATAILGLGALTLIGKGLLDLGQNLTPLPHPKEDGKLVQTGTYRIVRHPLYSGIILAAFSWAIFQLSLSHLIAAVLMFAFLDAKARREETWLTEKYPEYSDYQNRVKKLIPWLY